MCHAESSRSSESLLLHYLVQLSVTNAVHMVEPQPKRIRLRSDTAAQSADDNDDETVDGVAPTASLMKSEDWESSDNNDIRNNPKIAIGTSPCNMT